MRMTEVVPAPEEPVTETIGCWRDMAGQPTWVRKRPRVP
ncbi:hypothetical protein I553_5610 [Mycobacterium xenopi 4042]|uniref:Uncharacterized protein n=1 Tax=Mycobacterium xenopi 4042 TaxID=1299334 RepID=X7ZY29_MYCXE|nr:hypothetical protein I553_5610 [Mycobacterium xenopi 4042]